VIIIHRRNSIKWASVAFSAILIILGICITANPTISAIFLCYIIGFIALLAGVFKIISYFADDMYGLAFEYNLALGIISAAIGVVLILHPNNIIRLLPVIVGIFILTDGVFRFQTAVDAKKFGLSEWWLILLFAVFTGTMGLLLIIHPFSGTSLLMMLVGISFIVDGVQNLCVSICTIKSRKSIISKRDN